MTTWFDDLSGTRREWVTATRRNDFEAGIRGSTVDKYADPAHFVYELLQNAEDQEATWVRFHLEPDRLVFTHNGKPFTRQDVKSITGIGNSEKPKQANKIGRFGLGFKSVFAVSDRPEIYTTLDGAAFAFAVEDLVVPVRIAAGTDLAGGETRFVLPFKAGEADSTRRTIAGKLASLGADVLLFLNHIAEVGWRAGPAAGTYACDRSHPARRALREQLAGDAGDTTRESQFLLYARNVEFADADRPLSVRLAFRLDEQGQVAPEEKPTKLFVYFETEEQTGLRFRVHGPFLLTDNRANIKRGVRENALLIKECQALLLDALQAMKAEALLGASVLATLPNDNDDLPEYAQPVRKAVIDAMREHALVPVQGGGHAPSTDLAQGPQPIRELLESADLAFLSRGSVSAWAVGVMRNSRAEYFLRAVGVESWGWRELVAAVSSRFVSWNRSQEGSAWLAARPDAWMQHFYSVLYRGIQELDDSPYGFEEWQIVRIEDGTHVTGGKAYFPTEKGAALELPRVKADLLAGKSQTRIENARKLLGDLGVREVGEREELQAILGKHYASPASVPNLTTHLRHMRRFLAWWQQRQDGELFRDSCLFLDHSQKRLRQPSECYQDSPLTETGLRALYSAGVAGLNKHALWEGYQGLVQQGFARFAAALGVQDRLRLVRTYIPQTHPNTRDLRKDYLAARVRYTDSSVNEDYDIPHAAELLNLRDPEISRLIWAAMMGSSTAVLHARFRPNQQYEIRSAPSSIVLRLRDTAWIPDQQGAFRRPRDMTRSQLAPGFPFRDAEWLAAIGFGDAERQQSESYRRRQDMARELGIPLDLLERLDDLGDAGRQGMIERFSDLLDRELEPEFPERRSANPDRRAARLRTRLSEAPPKTREPRTRTVRTSKPATRTDAREYLRDLYTNADGAMICQACHRAMPFQLDNDEYYFEAVELFCDAGHEYRENHLAMCPTCAAMFEHACDVDLDEFRESLAAAADLRVTVTMAREERQIRFVEDHRADLLAVVAVEFQPAMEG